MKQWRNFREPFLEKNLPGFTQSRPSSDSPKHGNYYFGFFASLKDSITGQPPTNAEITLGDPVSTTSI
jgi:hypothetical protein